tara:strand:- start:4242 stop:4523 length:282 start_codon:yes stop_codon:yes gene_type:complete
MAKTRKAGKKGGVKLSAREKATRVKQRNLKKLENVVNKMDKKLNTAHNKVNKAQDKLNKEYNNVEALDLELKKAITDYEIAARAQTYNSLSNM